MWPFRRKPVPAAKPARDRSAVAYLVKDVLLIAPIVRATSGLDLHVEPTALPVTSSPSEISELLSDCLLRSEKVVPHPAQSEWAGFFQPFLKAAKVRSHKAFMTDARMVKVQKLAGGLKLTPQRNLGTRDGFTPMGEEALVVPGGDGDQIATALLEMLERDFR